MGIFEDLVGRLDGDTVGRIGRELGVDQQKAGTVTATAVSTLLGALSRNAESPDGARALHRALEKDHDGSLLDNLSGYVGGATEGPGDGILRHVLGDRRGRVENGLGRSTGIDGASAGKLLAMVAPVVMAALGRQQRQAGLDQGGLAHALGDERRELERNQPQAMGLVGQLLDADGDGDVDIGDMAQKGVGLLGKLFGK